MVFSLQTTALAELGRGAFCDCTCLTAVSLPQTLRTVGPQVFDGCCALSAIALPESVTSVASYAFSVCNSLTSLILPRSLTAIGAGAFMHSGITSLTLPPALTQIGPRAFTSCRELTSVTLPHALTTAGDEAFRDCARLSSVVFRPPVSRAVLIVWAVGSSHHRANWQVTTLRHSRNVLRLIAQLGVDNRDVDSVEPDGDGNVFGGCPCRVVPGS